MQPNLPGTDSITDAERAQRKAREPLKPKAEQKPMDIGMFGETRKQEELFR